MVSNPFNGFNKAEAMEVNRMVVSGVLYGGDGKLYPVILGDHFIKPWHKDPY